MDQMKKKIIEFVLEKGLSFHLYLGMEICECLGIFDLKGKHMNPDIKRTIKFVTHDGDTLVHITEREGSRARGRRFLVRDRAHKTEICADFLAGVELGAIGRRTHA